MICYCGHKIWVIGPGTFAKQDQYRTYVMCEIGHWSYLLSNSVDIVTQKTRDYIKNNMHLQHRTWGDK